MGDTAGRARNTPTAKTYGRRYRAKEAQPSLETKEVEQGSDFMVGIPLLSFPVFPQSAVTRLHATYGNEDLAETNHFIASEKLGHRALERCGTADPLIRRTS